MNTKDFPSLAQGKGLPYGVYDTGQNRAVVNAGVTHDTAEFAVESMRRWWKLDGRNSYPTARGAYSSVPTLGAATEIGFAPGSSTCSRWQIRFKFRSPFCHYPPGTGKCNKIEHRLFSFISLNWRGEPLIDYETIVNLIGGAKTRTGLEVKAVLGIKVSGEQLEETPNQNGTGVYPLESDPAVPPSAHRRGISRTIKRRG